MARLTIILLVMALSLGMFNFDSVAASVSKETNSPGCHFAILISLNFVLHTINKPWLVPQFSAKSMGDS